MRLLKTLTSLVVNLHIYLIVLGIIFLFPQSQNHLYGYLALFLLTTYFTFLPFVLFRSGSRFLEVYIFWLLYLGIGFAIIDFFYIQSRTDLYWLGMYTAVVTLCKITYLIYYNPHIFESSTSDKLWLKPFIPIPPMLAMWSIWTVLPMNTTEGELIEVMLIIYTVLSIIIELLDALKQYNWLPAKFIDLLLGWLFFGVLIASTIIIVVTAMIYDSLGVL